ncbi:DnaJ domain-containing protein [Mycena belliarum]|uniref:DnaJ domain-containing protein n=1 Tax=Mycena belliarum TaxID=1033014 RepID=A0AAD6U2A3_9AGAR|nr:DnaJ domain-containing protein [Mycena belliae]
MSKTRHETHYEVLGVERDATSGEIKDAFITLSKSHHPDIHNHRAEPEFHEITMAYSVLRDPITRQAYDASLPSTMPVQQYPEPEPEPTFYVRRRPQSGAFFGRGGAGLSPSTFRPPWRPLSTQFPRSDPGVNPMTQLYISPDPAASSKQRLAFFERNSSRRLLLLRRSAIPLFTLGSVLGLGWITGS